MRTFDCWTRLGGCLLVLGGGAAVAPALAQTPVMGGMLYREFDVGMRSYIDQPPDTARMYFERYRDLRSGVVVPDGRLWYVSENRMRQVELRVARLGQDDQAIGFMAERLGRYRLRVDVTDVPHVFNTGAKLLRGSNGLLSLPDPRPDTSAWNMCSPRSDGTLPAECAALYAGRFGVNSGRTRAQLSVFPAPAWNVTAEFDRTTKNGYKPMGMIMGSSPGHPTREILEPVDHALTRVRVAPSLVRPRYRLLASYEYSAFGNANDAVIADNPTLSVNSRTLGGAQGRSALAPDNTAHTFTLAGGADVPSTRFTGSVSYGVRRQNQAFLPFTINDSLNVSALSRERESLEGDVRTFVAQVAANARPTPRLTFGARLRHFQLDDRTPAYEQVGKVTGDRSVSTALFEREAYSHSRQQATFDARWRPGPALAVQLSAAYDAWQRHEHERERPETSEWMPRLLVDVTPLDWFSVRLSGSKAWRGGSAYNQLHPAQHPEGRKYDMATRERDRVDVAADLDLSALAERVGMPAPQALALGVLYGRSRTDYTKTRYGLQYDHNDARGATLDFTPISRLTLSAGYMFERWTAQAGSQYRAPGATINNDSYTWLSHTREMLETYSLGATVTVIPRRLEVGLWWDSTFGRTELHAFNPTAPSPVSASAAADSFPDMTYLLNPWSAVVRLNLSPTMMVTARVAGELFQQSDFRTDGLAPATTGAYYLGADPANYNARYFTVTFTYRPWIPGRQPAALTR